jgi:hypothetical protein
LPALVFSNQDNFPCESLVHATRAPHNAAETSFPLF